jgi:hypothetical protein
MAFPCTASDTIGKVRHLVEHGVDLGYDVLSIDDNGRSDRRAQCHMQNRALLGRIDLVSAEHGVDAAAQPGLLSELCQELNRLISYAVLRIVEVDARRFDRHALAALGVLREQSPQMQLANLFVMRRKRLPCRPLGERGDRCHVALLARFFESGALRGDHRHQLVPRFDERRRTFLLQFGGQRVDVDSSALELCEYRFAIAALGR